MRHDQRCVDGLKVARDMLSGMNEAALRQKYDISSPELEKISERIEGEIVKRGRAIVRDIRGGMPDWAIMRKHSFRYAYRYERCLTNLVGWNLITREEVADRLPLNGNGIAHVDTRSELRRKPKTSVFVIDEDDRNMVGKLLDISVSGLKAAGIVTKIEEVKALRVVREGFDGFRGVKLTAVCRWASRDDQETHIAGFEIERIDSQDAMELEFHFAVHGEDDWTNSAR